MKELTGFQVITKVKEIIQNKENVTRVRIGNTTIKVQALAMYCGCIDERQTTQDTIYIATNESIAKKLNSIQKVDGLLENQSTSAYQNSDSCISINVRDLYKFEYSDSCISIYPIVVPTSSSNLDQQVMNEVSKGTSYKDIATMFNLSLSDVYVIIGKE